MTSKFLIYHSRLRWTFSGCRDVFLKMKLIHWPTRSSGHRDQYQPISPKALEKEFMRMNSRNISFIQWVHWKKRRFGCCLRKTAAILKVNSMMSFVLNMMKLVQNFISYLRTGRLFNSEEISISYVRHQTSGIISPS